MADGLGRAVGRGERVEDWVVVFSLCGMRVRSAGVRGER